MRRRRILAFATSLTLHLLVAAAALRQAPPAGKPEPSPPKAMITFFVPPADDDSRFPGLNPIDTTREPSFARAKGASPLRINAFTFDVAKIADHAELLFPFLTPGLSLDHLVVAPETEMLERLGNLLASPRTGRQNEAANRPLALGDAGLQALTDKSWSRRHRWRAFQPILELADTHSPDVGELPALLQRYRQQNSLQPYDDAAIPDPRVWAELELAADHVDFIGFIRRYASEHSSTRATTELLFLLDDLVQSSRNVLGTLMHTDPQAQLTRTREGNRKAYDLIIELQQYYAEELRRQGLTSEDAITKYYDKVRLQILMGIVRIAPDGYRANDARFLIGAIHWSEQNTEDALHWWRELTVDQTDSHAATYAQITDALRFAGESASPDADRREAALKARINRILVHDYNRWLMFSVDRLWQFGYRFNTF